MKKVMVSPAKYVQGAGELENLATYIGDLGKKALLVASPDSCRRVRAELDGCAGLIDAGGFNGECSKKEIARLCELAVARGSDVVVGLGGGKAIDTAKAVAFYRKTPVIVVPTIASTDAPCSALSVIYTESGAFEEYLFFNRNPDVVLVDTAVIAKAPLRFLVAGMGDALSTWFEARACVRSDADNTKGGKTTKAALAIAELCYRTLLEDSVKAKAACEAQVVTKALENIIEANTLLSGIGFESSGLAAAHAVHNGLTILEETHRAYHGEKVAFGTIVLLVLENAPQDELDQVIGYCRSVGLPTCLTDLGVEDASRERLLAVARAATAPGETIHNMPFEVTAEMVLGAILAADRLGRM
jgi:glycerol dehydrogenase